MLLLLFRPHLLGEELYTQMGFFVQKVLADRYRREMRVASLKSSSSAEVKSKKIFLRFRGLRFGVNTAYLARFLFTFSVIFVHIKIVPRKILSKKIHFTLQIERISCCQYTDGNKKS